MENQNHEHENGLLNTLKNGLQNMIEQFTGDDEENNNNNNHSQTNNVSNNSQQDNNQERNASQERDTDQGSNDVGDDDAALTAALADIVRKNISQDDLKNQQ